MQLARYKVKVTVTLTKELAIGHLDGAPITQEILDLYPNTAIQWRPSYDNDGLTLSEETNLGGIDFGRAVTVLGQLHDALHAIGQGGAP